MKRNIGLVVALVLVAGVAWFLGRESAMPAVTTSSTPVSSEVAERPQDIADVGAGTPRDVVPAVEAVVAPTTIGDHLARYWGPRWEEMKERAIADGVDLSAVPDGPLPEWDAIAPEVEELVVKFSDDEMSGLEQRYLWPEPTTAEFLDKKFGAEPSEIGPVEIAEIDTLVQQHEPAIRDRLADFRRDVKDALHSLWVSRAYIAGPYHASNPTRAENGPMILTRTHVHKGWVICYTLNERDAPAATAQRAALKALVLARDTAVAQYLGNL